MNDPILTPCECYVPPLIDAKPAPARVVRRAAKKAATTRRLFWIRGRRLWRAAKAKSIAIAVWTRGVHVVVHHTADPGPRRKDVRLYLREIQRFHQETRGWSDIAYNYLIDPTGVVWEGRGWEVVGSHAPGYNTRGIGVCFMGTYSTQKPTPAQVQAYEDLLKNLRKRGAKIIGEIPHSKVYATSCPGDGIRRELDL